jgi:hypothetical protein
MTPLTGIGEVDDFKIVTNSGVVGKTKQLPTTPNVCPVYVKTLESISIYIVNAPTESGNPLAVIGKSMVPPG